MEALDTIIMNNRKLIPTWIWGWRQLRPTPLNQINHLTAKIEYDYLKNDTEITT